MDVSIKTENEKFKFRVCGLIVKDNKVLGVNICDNGFFCCPGGHVHLGEDTKTAIAREMKEEVGIDCGEEKLLAVVENFFGGEGKVFHELGFYYLLSVKDELLQTKDFDVLENDEGELKSLKFKWFDIDKLSQIDFKPKAIKEKLMKHDFNFEHIIYKD
ncbi:MAG: NUDIX domain-containing protein [Clostridia bacterium]|nr:NUDIX domain-containing protein [Clostridia bacterium]